MSKRQRKKVLKAGNPKIPWYRKAWVWLSAAGIVIAGVLSNGPTYLENGEKLYGTGKRYFAELINWYTTDQGFTGKWTNEGEIDIRLQQKIYVYLDLNAGSENAAGTISTHLLQEKFPLKFVLVEGKRNGEIIDATAYDYIGGHRKLFANFTIRKIQDIGKDPRLVLDFKWQALPLFPQTAEVWRDTTAISP